MLEDYLKTIIQDCSSKLELINKLGLSQTNRDYHLIKLLINRFNLDISHFKNNAWNKGLTVKNIRYKLEDVLVENSPIINTRSLKLRLIRNGLKQHKCEICGYEKKVELHHINGIPNDNRLDNLQILCPNCHAETDNYRGKNVIGRRKLHKSPDDYILNEETIELRNKARLIARKQQISINDILLNNSNEEIIELYNNLNNKQKKYCLNCNSEITNRHNQHFCSNKCYLEYQNSSNPDKEALIKIIIKFNCVFTKVAKYFNVSDNCIKKWLKKFGIPHIKHELISWLNNNYNIGIAEQPIIKTRIYDNDLIIKIYNEGYSQKEISNYLHCSTDYISKVLKNNNIIIRKGYCKKVIQYNLKHEKLNTFNSVRQCADWLVQNNICQLNNCKNHIIEVCNNRKHSAYGYIWSYIDRIPINKIV